MAAARTSIDLNADLGEGYGPWRLGDDAALLGVVTSANVACGFHAGDPATIRRTVEAAVAAGVRVGAQVAYPDLVGFGRRAMDVAPEDLTADVLYQVGALSAFCQAAGTEVAFVKPHGALYNRIVVDEGQARAVVAALHAWRPGTPLMTLPGSVAAKVAADAGLRVVTEAFADRAYTGDGLLADRRTPGSVLTDPDVIVRRVVAIARGEEVESVDGHPVTVTAESVCVHGDTPGAVEIARRVRAALQAAGVAVQPWT